MKKLFKYLLLIVMIIPFAVSAKDYGKLFSQITTDGTFIAPADEVDDCTQLETLLNTSIMNKFGGDYNRYYVESLLCEWNDPLNPTKPAKDENGYYSIYIYIADMDDPNHEDEYEEIKVKFEAELDNTIKTKIDSIKSKMDNKRFIVNDLGYISFINRIEEDRYEIDYINYALLYSNELLELIGNNNIVYNSDIRAGNDEPWNSFAFGFTSLFYNGVGYAGVDKTGPEIRQILYVPDDTEDTDDAYIAAALKRINAFLGDGNGITITKKNTITAALAYVPDPTLYTPGWQYIDQDVFDENYGGMTNKLDSIYEVTNSHGFKTYIFIEKDSSKITEPKFKVNDLNTNVTISTDDGSIPLDTTITVKYITEGEEFNNIKSKIQNDFSAINIDLFSYVTGSNITKTQNGKFIVSVPVPENLKGKSVTVYYITSSGELEEHKATVDDKGMATFETDHFSTYILTSTETEEEQEQTHNNPKTGDSLIIYISLMLLSIGGIYIISKRVNV